LVAPALLPAAGALAFSASILFAVLLPLVALDLGCRWYAARLLRKVPAGPKQRSGLFRAIATTIPAAC